MKPPAHICIIKISAIGDVCHAVPVVRTLRHALPDARLTWVIGSTEANLVEGLPGVEFIVLDKKAGARGLIPVKRQLGGQRYDVLLHMQYALRASMVSLLVHAERRIGFDQMRARDGQWLFTNERIAAKPREHVMDGLFGFAEALGIHERHLIWDLPVGDSDRAFAREHIATPGGALLISPSASNPNRNWRLQRYAQIADYAVSCHGLKVILTSGPGTEERRFAAAIADAMDEPAVNLAGKTSLKQLLALFQRARCLLTPDSGPAHIGTAAGIPVIGLYAVSNPERAGPYLSRNWIVNRYPENVRGYFGKAVEDVPWGARVRDPAGMDRISVEDVKCRLDGIMACAAAGAGGMEGTGQMAGAASD